MSSLKSMTAMLCDNRQSDDEENKQADDDATKEGKQGGYDIESDDCDTVTSHDCYIDEMCSSVY